MGELIFSLVPLAIAASLQPPQVIATLNFSEDPNVLVMIIVYSLITMIVMTPLAGELGKRAKAAQAAVETDVATAK